MVDELAAEYEGRLKVVKINVDDNPQVPARFGVRGIPNLVIVKGGEVKQQIVGAVPKKNLVGRSTTRSRKPPTRVNARRPRLLCRRR